MSELKKQSDEENKESQNKIQEILRTNNEQLEQINQQHKKEMEDLYYNSKFQIQKIQDELDKTYKELSDLKINNENMQNIISE